LLTSVYFNLHKKKKLSLSPTQPSAPASDPGPEAIAAIEQLAEAARTLRSARFAAEAAPWVPITIELPKRIAVVADDGSINIVNDGDGDEAEVPAAIPPASADAAADAPRISARELVAELMISTGASVARALVAAGGRGDGAIDRLGGWDLLPARHGDADSAAAAVGAAIAPFRVQPPPPKHDGNLRVAFASWEASREKHPVAHEMLKARSMVRAFTHVRPGRHYGLAKDTYMHVTSPIRRYTDLVSQRLVKTALVPDPLPLAHFGAGAHGSVFDLFGPAVSRRSSSSSSVLAGAESGASALVGAGRRAASELDARLNMAMCDDAVVRATEATRASSRHHMMLHARAREGDSLRAVVLRPTPGGGRITSVFVLEYGLVERIDRFSSRNRCELHVGDVVNVRWKAGSAGTTTDSFVIDNA
jgi:hypothetical protein